MPLFSDETMKVFERLRGEERELVKRVQEENAGLYRVLATIADMNGGRLVIPAMVHLIDPVAYVYRDPMTNDIVVTTRRR